jgi:hypothetical protein
MLGFFEYKINFTTIPLIPLIPVTLVIISRRRAKTQKINYQGCLHPIVKTKIRPRGLNLDLTPFI